MKLTRAIGLTFVFVALGVSASLAACGSAADGLNGAGGDPGPAGPPGPPGLPGAPGPSAEGGAALSGACTTPCHTFGGVVDQWRFSHHSHPQQNEIGGGVCGNCHAIDGLQNRLSNKYTVAPDAGVPADVPKGHLNFRTSSGSVSEIGYGGATAIGRIHCSTCHDFNPTNDPHVTGKYVKGQAAIRVPGGVSDQVVIERTGDPSAASPTGTPLAYRAGNVCVFCHKSRKDVTFYVRATNNTLSSVNWGPHEGPQADVYSGKGGYEFAGLAYASSAHAGLADACVSCHMRPVAANGDVPDHTMKPAVAFCKTCHTQYTGTSFDIQNGQTLVRDALGELQAALNAAGMLTRSGGAPYAPLADDQLEDRQFHLDKVRPGGAPGGGHVVADGPTAGALYNYLVVARSKDLGVHNPTYAKQLLWDSIKQVTGADPVNLPGRPQ
ncbi:MAG: hypothetical protein KF819_02415 [Labilithrix sp.]|nr:hypothetical protein [Labilithrix sp.]